MTQRRRPAGQPPFVSFEVTDYLRTEDDIVCYVKVVLEDSTTHAIVTMIDDVSQASKRMIQRDKPGGSGANTNVWQQKLREFQ